MDNDMVRRLDRIREIGCEIARLSEEAKGTDLLGSLLLRIS